MPVPMVRITASLAPAGGSRPMLGQRRHVAVVVHEHRQAQPLGHDVAEGNVGQREVHRDHAPAGPLVHQARDSEADRGDFGAGRLPSFLNGFYSDVEQRRLVKTGHGALGAMVDSEPLIDRSGQDLRPAHVDADGASAWHVDHYMQCPICPRTPPSRPQPDDRPYRVYSGGEASSSSPG